MSCCRWKWKDCVQQGCWNTHKISSMIDRYSRNTASIWQSAAAHQLEGATAAMAKYIFVTGGVASSVGKGITVASIGRLLKSRGLRVSIQKLDPYINVDPGTMSPYQHGEVFVTDDGAETDLDLGHYERFIDENLTRLSNV